MENNNLNVLDEVNKGATMGMDAIKFIEEKNHDAKLEETLKVEYGKYKHISERVNNLYSEYTTTKFPGSQYMSVYNHALLPAYPSILPNFARRRKHRL